MHTLFATSHRSLMLAALLLLAGCAGLFASSPLITDPNRPTGELLINNQSGITVIKVQIDPCERSTFSGDRLGSDEVIPHGRQRSFMVTIGCWDIRLTGRDGSTVVKRLQVNTNGMRYTVGYEN